ncbi:MAG: hypothetical protein R3250_00170 [Melioribacteraceae bacterium]|nr:hypothetical protein [Melioribacteraceae bacterium]
MKEFYLNCTADYRIIDENGEEYTVAEAKNMWETFDLDCNLAFARLVENNFDLDATKAYYEG